MFLWVLELIFSTLSVLLEELSFLKIGTLDLHGCTFGSPEISCLVPI